MEGRKRDARTTRTRTTTTTTSGGRLRTDGERGEGGEDEDRRREGLRGRKDDGRWAAVGWRRKRFRVGRRKSEN
jgi:hypothetical protein